MITHNTVKTIYASHGIEMSEKDLVAVTEHCNENGAVQHGGLTAREWAERFAREDAASDCADAGERDREDDRE